MAIRIYIISKSLDARNKHYKKMFMGLGISANIKNVLFFDSYTFDMNLEECEINKIAEALTNSKIENYFVNKIPNLNNFDFACEIGYLPGVTDNVSHTIKEEVEEILKRKLNDNEGIYTSKLFCLAGKINNQDREKISNSLYNPLIERCQIINFKNLKKEQIIPITIPLVKLEKRENVASVSLNISDEELVKIGNFGISNDDGSRRGPLALDLESMKVIQKYFQNLKRDPTDIELESLAQTWSEHCKHTIFANSIDDIKDGLYKTYIKGATNLIRKNKKERKELDICVSVFSDNAGGIIFDDKYLITHKVETHNSPSALDPFGGAITGIVGVNRDTVGFGMGAKPIANTFGFCFGNPEDKRILFRDKDLTQKMLSSKRIMAGVIRGVNTGGNCSGIPTISGFVRYDEHFRGKPLVFVGTVGLIPREINNRPSHVKAAQNGDYIVVVGGKVGADGIHGATFSSVVMDSSSPATAVQIGDPITQKKLSDAIVKEARDRNLYNSITDNGAGGISCSVAEMAKECGGAEVEIEKVQLKYPGLSPWQIWVSESQERMTLSVPKGKWEEFYNLMESRGVLAVCIGVFTDSGKCIVKDNGKIIMDIDMEFLHNGLPRRQLETEKFLVNTLEPKIILKKSYNKDFLDLMKNKNISSFKFISEQYDHEVQAGSVLKPVSGQGSINTDAQVFRPLLNSKKGIVLSAALYPSYSDINTYDMAAASIDTAIRNVIASGGKLNHIAILDNFCWCSSNDKKRLSQLVDSYLLTPMSNLFTPHL